MNGVGRSAVGLSFPALADVRVVKGELATSYEPQSSERGLTGMNRMEEILILIPSLGYNIA